MSRPEDLDGAPQVEHEEDDRFVLHLLQAAEDDEQNDVPTCHLQHHRAQSFYSTLKIKIWCDSSKAEL